MIGSNELPFDVNSVCIRLTDSASVDTDEIARIVAQIESFGATVMQGEDLFGTMPATVSGFMSMIRDAMVASFALLLVGSFNSFLELYRLRNNERMICRLCGQSAGKSMLLMILEVVFLVLCSFAVAVCFGILFCIAVHHIMISFGFSLFV